jgi:hypothetical protein
VFTLARGYVQRCFAAIIASVDAWLATTTEAAADAMG